MQTRQIRLAWLVPVLTLALGAPLAGGAQATRTGQGHPQGQTRDQGPGAGDRGQRGPSTVGWEWWKDKELGLPAEKVAQLDRFYNDRQRRLMPFLEEYRRELQTLDKLTTERVVDSETFAVQVSRVEALRSKLSESRTVLLYQMYRQLSAEQYQKLRQLRDQRDQRFRNGRGAGSVPGVR